MAQNDSGTAPTTLEAAFNQQYVVPVDTAAAGLGSGPVAGLSKIQVARQQQLREISVEIEADSAKKGTFNPLALQRLQIEIGANEHIARTVSLLRSVEPSMNAAELQAAAAIQSDSATSGTISPAQLGKLYLQVQQRLGKVPPASAGALSRALELGDTHLRQVQDQSMKIAQDAAATGAWNPVALQRLQIDATQTEAVLSTTIALLDQAAQLPAQRVQAIEQAAASGNVDQLRAVLWPQ